MKEYRADIDKTLIASRKVDTRIEWLLIILLAFMPLALGVRSAWSEEIVVAISGLIVIIFLLSVVLNNEPDIVWNWAYLPIGLFLLVSLFQLISLPSWLMEIISPNTVSLRQELLGGLKGADTSLRSMPISFYKNATEHDLRIILSVAAVFIVVLNVFRRPEQIKRLLLSIAMIGGLVAIIALAQAIFGNGKIYWFINTYYSNALSGPFINHNHYGQFMNLSIGAALAYFCVKIHENFINKNISTSTVYDYLSSDSARILWLLLVIMILGTASVFISLTRGGMLSTIISLAFVTLLLISRPSLKGHGWIMAVMALGAFACVLYIGFDAVYNRFATIRDLQGYEERLQILKDLTVSYRQFPVLGTGLGTHEVVYPMFKNINKALLYTHAENEYAQVLEETGFVGLITLMIFGAIVIISFAKNIRNIKRPISSAVYGLGFGLLAILVHSFSDFGQHIPANAFLSAIFCALLLSLAQKETNHNCSMQRIKHSHALRGFYVVVLIGVCGVWIWSLVGANKARVAEACWAKGSDLEKRIAANNWNGTESEYAELISNAEKALTYQPDNVKYQYWLNVYRWRSISQQKDPDTGIAIVSQDSKYSVNDIVNGFNKACLICPTYGPPYSVVGQIEKFILHDNDGIDKIRKGFRLAPSDPVTCFVAGRIDVLEGKTQDAILKFDKAVQLDGNLFADVVDIYVNQLSQPNLAISIAGDNINWLSHVISILEDMQYNDLAELVRDKIRILLEAKTNEPDVPGSVFARLGSIYSEQGNSEAAAEYYRKALARDYGQVQWRLELARILVEMGEVPEAMSEAKICLQLRPQLKAAETFVADLSVHPAVLANKNISP